MAGAVIFLIQGWVDLLSGYNNKIELDLSNRPQQFLVISGFHLVAVLAASLVLHFWAQLLILTLVVASAAQQTCRIHRWPWRDLLWQPSGALLVRHADGQWAVAQWATPPRFQIGIAWLRFNVAGKNWSWCVLRKDQTENYRALVIRCRRGDALGH